MTTFRRMLFALLAVCALVLTACASNSASTSSSDSDSSTASETPGTGGSAIGFLYVGPKDDYGYNQAAAQGAAELGEAFPDYEILEAESVPETAEVEQKAEQMISQGAKIIFTTSYGYKDYALNLAEKHPDVVFLQQGNTLEGDIPNNIGTYFGNVYEPVYLAGIAAGKATTSNKLGYVAAFPIPQTLLNINAFELGAQSVNPDAETYTVFTSAWCDPGKQSQAAESLLNQGVDVLTQHQDCTSTITQAAEKAGASVVGYHADASELAPEGWLTGSEWDWGPLYIDMVTTIDAEEFAGGKYNGNYRVGYKKTADDAVDAPLVQSAFGPSVTDETKTEIAAAKEEISTTGSPFAGPVYDQDGNVVIEDGVIPEYSELESMDYLVQGVVGEIPAS